MTDCEAKEKATVSVAMATYNGARYLPQQLASLASQERLPDELVITDDNSSDGTPEVVASFAESAPFPVKFFSNERQLGVRDNFQRALSLCEGDVVLLSDQDDAWLPGKIRRLMEVFQEHEQAMVVMNDKIIADAELRPSNATMLSNIRGYGGRSSLFVAGCCAAIRRPWLDLTLPIPDGIDYHDVWILGLAHDLGVVVLCEEALQYYRRHGANASEGPFSATRKLTLIHRARAELGLLLEKKMDAQRKQWRVELRWALAKAERLLERKDDLARLGLGQAATVLSQQMTKRAAVIEERCRLSGRGLVRRSIGSLKLWRRGGYAQFAGWKSLLQDLTLR
jgi:glycosyltransferase involved in cell wall biosynthesis